jgi:predicted ATP-dependent endonuclease of OLD family
MKLISIGIKKLFGQFDYTIKLDQKENITIITGPNGYGKSTILNIIWNVFSNDFSYLLKVKFDQIDFETDNDQSISIIRHRENNKVETLVWDYVAEAEDDTFYPRKPEAVFKIIFTNSRKKTESLFIDDETNIGQDTKIFSVLQSLSIYFIEDQRLLQNIVPTRDGLSKRDGSIKRDGKPVAIDTIKILSHDLCKILTEKQNEEKKLIDELEPSLAKRFKEYKTILSPFEYQERFQKLSQKYKKLQEYGIYYNDLESTEYEGDDRRFFSLNLEDWEKKTSVYDDLLVKLDLFVELLGNKGLANKKINIGAEEGFFFTTEDGKELDLAALSSGEQHETILLYELIFKARPNSLVLIDEPETSMHVAWQYEFIPDLKKIIDVNPLLFFIATHSPDIINDQDPIDLYELIHGESEDE